MAICIPTDTEVVVTAFVKITNKLLCNPTVNIRISIVFCTSVLSVISLITDESEQLASAFFSANEKGF